MSYVSGLSFFQLPTANLKTQNDVLNSSLAKQATDNGGVGISSATGTFYKHDPSVPDKYDQNAGLIDPSPLCILGPDWSDSTISYKETPNLYGSNDNTTIGCISYGRTTAFSDVNVINGNSTCQPQQLTVKALQYPAAYNLIQANSKTDAAMTKFGVSGDYALCVSYDVLNPKRISDLQFIKGNCPAGYTADPTSVNGFTMCKAFADKPSDAVLAEIQKEQDDMNAAKAKLAATVAEAEKAQEEANFANLTLLEKIETNKTYQLYIAIGAIGCILIFSICVLLCIAMSKDGDGEGAILSTTDSGGFDYNVNYA